MKRPEQTLHLQVARFLAVALRPPTFWTSIEHAAKLGPVAATMRKRRGAKAGLPDILIFHPYPQLQLATLCIAFELKAPKGIVSEAQEKTLGDLCAAQVQTHIVRGMDDVMRLLNGYGIPLHARLS